LTYYNNKCKFTPHVDEYAVKLCSILVYLNENYDKNNGGLLLLNDEEVIPTFGKCAIMDLSTHHIKHGVSEVIGGIGRYAILSFPTIKK
jgi:Rps23 Pro-64 3,4-dihydroxylase Tpa1-like proline 4-hydroxylase